ncbi:MAG: MarR family transcriptional regulator [Candidatus Altiarchaeota archaeon]|nr:MarR family transcriptional regulator [Candidatus Altiarchaeota archaeon]
MKLTSNKVMGLILIVCSVVVATMLAYIMDQSSQETADSCTCGDSCEMKTYEIPKVIYFGAAALMLMVISGILLLIKKDSEKSIDRKAEWNDRGKNLEPDEKKIYSQIVEKDGAAFQSELVEKAGFTKVKVTRILDKLEANGLLERRRRGLTNLIVLKDKKE